MNNGAYMGQDGQTIGTKLQELLGKDLGAGGPIPFTVETEGTATVSLRSVLGDLATTFFGGRPTPLFAVHFEVSQPRAFQLEAHMHQQGMGCATGSLAYSAKLGKKVGGAVRLGDDGKFSGDAETAGKLNGKKEVVKKCEAFAVKQGGIAGFELKIPRTLQITPHEGGAKLVAVTLPKSKSMGFGATLGAKEFLEMVAAVEGAL